MVVTEQMTTAKNMLKEAKENLNCPAMPENQSNHFSFKIEYVGSYKQYLTSVHSLADIHNHSSL